MGWHLDWHKDWHKDWHGPAFNSAIPGYGPSGVATLVLDLEQGFKVTHEWITDVIKARSGKEQRSSRNDVARQRFQGSAIMFGDEPRLARAKMARYAAIGSQFLLALPHEQLTLRAATSGTTVPVHSTALVDWAKPGQRVVVGTRGADGGWSYVNAVIQPGGTSTTIVLDVSPGMAGGVIMPALPVLLEPQQTFPRYRTNAERWEISAIAETLDFAPTLATLALGPITATAGLDSAVLTSKKFGISPVYAQFFEDASYPAAGSYAELGTIARFFFKGGVTTVGDLVNLANTQSNLVKFTGSWTAGATLASGTGDEFGPTQLTGASESGDVGTGATLTTYDGDGTVRQVWNRQIDNEGTNADSVQAMTVIVDHGGKPYSIGTADHADWGRAVVLRGGDHAEWQWWKKFLHTVKGRQKSWWLPTWRDDLPFVSKATNTITIDGDASDFAAWWPDRREHIQIVEASGTITRKKITAAVDNGDGTWTLTIGTTLATSSVEMVSWLELVRFEADSFELMFDEEGFSV